MCLEIEISEVIHADIVILRRNLGLWLLQMNRHYVSEVLEISEDVSRVDLAFSARLDYFVNVRVEFTLLENAISAEAIEVYLFY